MSAVRLVVPAESLAALCRRWNVPALWVFGSALREDFRPDSDIDLLVAFAPGARWRIRDLFRLEDELAALFGRKVDLVERDAVEEAENWLRRQLILDEAKPLYVAG
jgi:predicted nucleotidyltransferase